jgi:hypothetical protein
MIPNNKLCERCRYKPHRWSFGFEATAPERLILLASKGSPERFVGHIIAGWRITIGAVWAFLNILSLAFTSYRNSIKTLHPNKYKIKIKSKSSVFMDFREQILKKGSLFGFRRSICPVLGYRER